MADDAYSISVPGAEHRTAPLTGACPFPLPGQQAARAIQLLAGLRRLEALQIEIAAKLIDLLDESEPDADDEPELGAAERASGYALTVDQRHWSSGADAEPSLGASADVSQRFWGFIDYRHPDLEDEHDGREPEVEDEPSLGSVSTVDQRLWAEHMAPDAVCWIDREEQCEDEGGQCDDDGWDSDSDPDIDHVGYRWCDGPDEKWSRYTRFRMDHF